MTHENEKYGTGSTYKSLPQNECGIIITAFCMQRFLLPLKGDEMVLTNDTKTYIHTAFSFPHLISNL